MQTHINHRLVHAQVKLEKCELQGSRKYSGLEVRGGGSVADATACKFHSNEHSGVFVLEARPPPGPP